jgi:hypothetical protein
MPAVWLDARLSRLVNFDNSRPTEFLPDRCDLDVNQLSGNSSGDKQNVTVDSRDCLAVQCHRLQLDAEPLTDFDQITARQFAFCPLLRKVPAWSLPSLPVRTARITSVAHSAMSSQRVRSLIEKNAGQGRKNSVQTVCPELVRQQFVERKLQNI